MPAASQVLSSCLLFSFSPVSPYLVPLKANVCRDGTKSLLVGLRFFFSSLLSSINICSICCVYICLSGHICASGVYMHMCMCDNKKAVYRGVAVATASPYCILIMY